MIAKKVRPQHHDSQNPRHTVSWGESHRYIPAVLVGKLWVHLVVPGPALHDRFLCEWKHWGREKLRRDVQGIDDHQCESKRFLSEGTHHFEAWEEAENCS